MREWTGTRLLYASIGEVTPQVDILRPKSRCWGRVPHHWYCMPTWMYLANGDALLCVDPTQSSETRKVRGLHWHSLLRERKGK